VSVHVVAIRIYWKEQEEKHVNKFEKNATKSKKCHNLKRNIVFAETCMQYNHKKKKKKIKFFFLKNKKKKKKKKKKIFFK